MDKHSSKDWHSALISAKLKELGTSLSALSVENGFHRNTLRGAIYKHYPKAERIIAEKLGVSPADIWGSRYDK